MPSNLHSKFVENNGHLPLSNQELLSSAKESHDQPSARMLTSSLSTNHTSLSKPPVIYRAIFCTTSLGVEGTQYRCIKQLLGTLTSDEDGGNDRVYSFQSAR